MTLPTNEELADIYQRPFHVFTQENGVGDILTHATRLQFDAIAAIRTAILDALIAEAKKDWTDQGYHITNETEDSCDFVHDWLRSMKDGEQ